MVYNTQNYWVFRLCPSSDVLKARKHKVFTVQLPPYAKSSKIWLMNLAARDVISSSTVIPKVSLTGLLIIRVAVI
jgi:hypothetical protein